MDDAKREKLPLGKDIERVLAAQGADIIKFVDISSLSEDQNKHFPVAVLMGIILSKDYLKKVSDASEYFVNLIQNNRLDEDEFHQKEIVVEKMADNLADYIESKGFSAYSQSIENVYSTGYYDKKSKRTPLPQKTIARLAGIGWLGKHNLLVTREYGSALCICTVLTDAPLTTEQYELKKNQCGRCEICKEICPQNAIKGNPWSVNTDRDELVDVHKCFPCLKCMVLCPWTQRYIKKA